ncbi:MAG: hypothetical protein KJ709_00090 [Nanoarchaeota archaeon]|nr:hypothetical protein [Nanoarchaeota archaeon]
MLLQFSPDEMAEFKSDFRLLMDSAFEVDNELSSVAEDLNNNIPKYKALLWNFKKKYPSLFIEVDYQKFMLKPKIFMPCISLKELFMQVVSNIDGLTSVGATMTEPRQAVDRNKLSQEAQLIKDRLQAHFVGYKSNYLLLKFVEGKGAMLIYDQESVSDVLRQSSSSVATQPCTRATGRTSSSSLRASGMRPQKA